MKQLAMCLERLTKKQHNVAWQKLKRWLEKVERLTKKTAARFKWQSWPNEVEAGGEEGKEGKEEEDRGGPLRESALKAAVALATGSGGLTAEAKKRLLERIVDLGKLEGEEKMYAEDELNLLKEVTKAK